MVVGATDGVIVSTLVDGEILAVTVGDAVGGVEGAMVSSGSVKNIT